jgi:hypothetical protein
LISLHIDLNGKFRVLHNVKGMVVAPSYCALSTNSLEFCEQANYTEWASVACRWIFSANFCG